MRIIHDYYNRNDPSTIYLATPNKDILCALNSIDATSVDFVGKCNDLSTLTFTINRYTENSKGDRIKANGYEIYAIICYKCWLVYHGYTRNSFNREY